MESDISVLLGDDVLHPVYLPLSASTLSRHFAPVSRAITDMLRPRWFVPTESTRASLFISQSRSEARELTCGLANIGVPATSSRC
jgi:hypothetical protein